MPFGRAHQSALGLIDWFVQPLFQNLTQELFILVADSEGSISIDSIQSS